MNVFYISFLFIFYYIEATPQAEINDQFVTLEVDTEDANKTIEDNVIIDNPNDNETENTSIQLLVESSFTTRICEAIWRPIIECFTAPKVLSVLRNIGTCAVNGAMELVSHYLPAPFIPLIASVAGFVIPFEPVVLLREKMPVTSYRRAFSTAVNSFLSTFDKYKRDDEEDPYMTRRFNRRFMDISSEKKGKVIK